MRGQSPPTPLVVIREKVPFHLTVCVWILTSKFSLLSQLCVLFRTSMSVYLWTISFLSNLKFFFWITNCLSSFSCNGSVVRLYDMFFFVPVEFWYHNIIKKSHFRWKSVERHSEIFSRFGSPTTPKWENMKIWDFRARYNRWALVKTRFLPNYSIVWFEWYQNTSIYYLDFSAGNIENQGVIRKKKTMVFYSSSPDCGQSFWSSVRTIPAV